MIRFLINTAIYFAAALIALAIADLLLAGFHLDVQAYLLAALIFGLIQAILSPAISKIARKSAPMFMGGIGIISAAVALWLTALIMGSKMQFDGPKDWLVASILVWAVGALAAFLLPMIFVKNKVQDRRAA